MGGHSLSEGSESPDPSPVGTPLVVVVQRLVLLAVVAANAAEAAVVAIVAAVAVAVVAVVVVVPDFAAVVAAVAVAAESVVVAFVASPYSVCLFPAGGPVEHGSLAPPAGNLEKPLHLGWS